MIDFKRTAAAAIIGIIGFAGIASAAGHQPNPNATPTAPGQNKIACFDGTTDGGFGGTCTLKSNGAKGTAILSNTSSNPNGDYSGVYTPTSSIYGQLLTDITRLGYSYSGTTSPLPGNLSYNIPIDTDDNGTTDGYAFVDAYYCSGVNGNVDIINDADCGIWLNGVEYANWAALVAAFPGATVAPDNYVFIIAERTPSEPAATWTIHNVMFGKPGK